MRVAISNIAWDVEEDDLVSELLSRYGIDAIDIALGKYSVTPVSVTNAEVLKIKNYWFEKGIEITGMQSLLFGKSDLNVFGTSATQIKLLDYLEKICYIASMLGASKLVFGSPKNRDRTGLSDTNAMDKGVKFFRQLGDVAQSNDVIVCLEPNPACYGSNFMTSSKDTLAVVKATNHPAIRMQLDTGAMVVNQESFAHVIDVTYPYIGHIHLSEPDLSALGTSGVDHKNLAYHIKNIHNKLSVVTIEMLATKEEPHLISIERALKLATYFYQGKK